MKTLKRTWKRIVALIASCFGIGTLVACYGMPLSPDMEDYKGSVTGEISGKEQPIPGVQITYCTENFDLETVLTDEDGNFSIHHNSFTALDFDDIDGEENGSFESKRIYPSDYPDNKNMIIKLSPKTSDPE